MSRTTVALRWAALAGFGFGTATHALDVWRYGWWPYAFGGPVLDAFWNMLVLLDAAVVALLLVRPAWGIAAGIVLMVADVAANTYAWQVLGIDAFAVAVPLQTGFLLVLLAAAWRMRGVGARR